MEYFESYITITKQTKPFITSINFIQIFSCRWGTPVVTGLKSPKIWFISLTLLCIYESNSTVTVGAAADVSVNIPGDTDQEQDKFLLNLVDLF